MTGPRACGSLSEKSNVAVTSLIVIVTASLIGLSTATPSLSSSPSALAWPDGVNETFEGRVDGVLVFPPRGTAGFGYDPIFRPDGHNRTFGEMTADEKHGIPADGSLALSHRARAFQKLQRARL